MRFSWLKARQTKYTAYVVAYLLVVLAVLSAANFLANRYNKSFDSTTNKRYSLSPQTEKVVKGLKQDARITYFDKTSQLTAARDLLDLYGKISPKLRVKTMHFFAARLRPLVLLIRRRVWPGPRPVAFNRWPKIFSSATSSTRTFALRGRSSALSRNTFSRNGATSSCTTSREATLPSCWTRSLTITVRARPM